MLPNAMQLTSDRTLHHFLGTIGAIEIISRIKAVINTYFFNAQDHCMRPALINAK